MVAVFRFKKTSGAHTTGAPVVAPCSSHMNGVAPSSPSPLSTSRLPRTDILPSDHLFDSGSSQSQPPKLEAKPEGSVLNSESPEEGRSQSPHPEKAPDLPDNLSTELAATIAKLKQVCTGGSFISVIVLNPVSYKTCLIN